MSALVAFPTGKNLQYSGGMKIFLSPDEAGGGNAPENTPPNVPAAAPDPAPAGPPAGIFVAEGRTERELQLERELEARQLTERDYQTRISELERDRENLLTAGRVQRPKKKTNYFPTVLDEE